MDKLYDSLAGGEIVVTAEDIKSVSDPSPLFLRWAWNSLDLDRLSVMVGAVIKAGKTGNTEEALKYLNRLFTDFPKREITVALKDIKKPRAAGARFRKLSNLVSGDTPSGKPLPFTHGELGHRAINALLTGELTQASPGLVKESPSSQLPLFVEEPEEETLVVSKSGQYYLPRLLQKTKAEKETRKEKEVRKRDIFRRIEHHFRVISKAMNGDDFKSWHKKKRNVNCLTKWLLRLFGPLAETLIQRYTDSSRDLLTLTLMTWASIATYYRGIKRKNKILFREIKVVRHGRGLSGGRADAFEVISVQGRPLSKLQQRVIAGIDTEHIKSAGHLFRELIRILGKPLELRVIDWKFLAGDIIERDIPASLPDFESGPLARHLDQIKGYMTLSTFDYLYFRRGNSDGKIWGQEDFRLTGEIWYLVPWGEPIVHKVSMTPKEMEEYFTENYAYLWSRAKWWAEIRDLNNLVVNHLIRLLEKGDDPTVFNNQREKVASRIQSLPFEGESLGYVSVSEVIERHRKKAQVFLDEETRILRVVGRHEDGRPKLELRFDKLLKAVEAGKVPTRHFGSVSQFFVSCLAPDHHDPGPSLCVSLRRNPPSFKCFGCQIGGKIAPDSIPPDIALEMAPEWAKARKNTYKDWAVRPPEISPEHNLIMSQAQKILHLSFWSSPAVQYLAKERKIDPHLAYELGVGFGSENVISSLLESDYTYEDLLHYGFLGISSRVRPDRGIVPLLLERGLSLDELERESGLSVSGQRLFGLPYNVLSGRVTFPLKLRGKYANFYGRVLPGFLGRKHLKLSNSQTKAEQGGFNMEVFESDDPEAMLTEGALDALTWMQIQGGRQNASAVIGTDNLVIVSEAGRSEKTIGPALDYDQSGRKITLRLLRRLLEIRDKASLELVSELEKAEEEMKTAHKEKRPDYEVAYRIFEKLVESGVTREKGGIKDYTAEFVADHPECQKRDFDINEWWVQFGCKDAPGKWED